MKVKVSEASVSQSVKEALQIAENQHKLIWFRNNIAKVNMQDGRFFQTGKKGFGDFIGGFFDKHSRCLAYFEVECKSDSGKQSKEQVEHQVVISNLWGQYWLVNPKTLQEFLDWLSQI